MTNLGSDTTPATLESVTLPSGYTVDEDGGDLVVRDTGGTVALRRVDGGAWSLESNALNNVGSLDASGTASAADFELPAGAKLDEDGGDLVVRDSGGTIVLRRDEATSAWDFGGEDVSGVGSLSTDNIGLRDVTGDGLPAQAIEHGKAWADDGKLYSTVQGAESAASSLVIAGPGTFAEHVVIDTANLTLTGCGRGTLIDGDDRIGIDVQADGVTIENLAVQTTSGAGNNVECLDITSGSEGTLQNLWIEESDRVGIRLTNGETDWRMVSIYCDSANIDSDDISISGDESVIDDIIGSVTDGGTGNTVGDTA